MAEQPKVSIIIPVYNAEKFLENCLESAINQTYKNIEIICINDGSTDNSMNILQKYKSDTVKVVSIKNHGVGYARNLGIDRAEGDYILFLDSDDYLVIDCCKDLVENILEKHSDMVYCGHYTRKPTGEVTKEWVPSIIISDNPIDDRLKITKYLVVTKKLFKKSIIKDNNIKFNTELHYAEDSLFLIQYLTFCKKVTGVKKALYNDVINSDSLCRNPSFKMRRRIELRQSFNLIDKIIKDYKKKQPKKSRKKYRYPY